MPVWLRERDEVLESLNDGPAATTRFAWVVVAIVVGAAVSSAVLSGIDYAAGFRQDPALMIEIAASIVIASVGALIVSRMPAHRIGWLCIAIGTAWGIARLGSEYAARTLIVAPGSLPGGLGVAQLATAAAALIFPAASLLLVWFPTGHAASNRWALVAWASAAVGLVYMLILTLASPRLETDTGVALGPNPAALPFASSTLRDVEFNAVFILLLVSASSLVWRLRSATGASRQQLKILVYVSALIVGLGLVLLPIYELYPNPHAMLLWVENTLWYSFYSLYVLGVPLAIGIAILRYRLYDIDLIINRTLVYVCLTAILAAAYTAGVALFQRLFISASGQRSDAAYVLSAFVIVICFSPLKDWLQQIVNQRLGGARAAAALDRFSSAIESVMSVMDVRRTVHRLVDESVTAFDAHGAAVYLSDSDEPVYHRGTLNGGRCVEVPIRHGGRELGRLVLAERRGDLSYGERDRKALQKSADWVGEALALSYQLGLDLTDPAIRC